MEYSNLEKEQMLIYSLLLTEYTQKYKLPLDFDSIDNIVDKTNLLGLALEKKMSLEELEEYKLVRK